LKALRALPDEAGMNEYWAALCVAESFTEKALRKFGGIDFHTMTGPKLLARMEEFLEYRSNAEKPSSKKLNHPPKKNKLAIGNTITASVSESEIIACMSPKGGWKRSQLEKWGVPWPPPKGWKAALIKNGTACE
jgi:hypothetical protein